MNFSKEPKWKCQYCQAENDNYHIICNSCYKSKEERKVEAKTDEYCVACKIEKASPKSSFCRKCKVLCSYCHKAYSYDCPKCNPRITSVKKKCSTCGGDIFGNKCYTCAEGGYKKCPKCNRPIYASRCYHCS
jgi:hypothetical protein